MSFFRHEEIYRSDVVCKTNNWTRGTASRWSAPESRRTRRKARALLIVHDEFPVGYSLAGCSPAEPASASPTAPSMRWEFNAGNYISANGNLSLIFVSQRRGALQVPLSQAAMILKQAPMFCGAWTVAPVTLFATRKR